MGKEKGNSSRKIIKKSRSVRSPKSRRDSSSSASSDDHTGSKDIEATTTTKLNRKQKELKRIYDLKVSILVSNELPYIEYVELSEEIGRLAALKDAMACKAAGIEKP